MYKLPCSVKIYMASKPVDMRNGFDGLMSIVKNQWKKDVFSGHLFVFLGVQRDRVKILHWDTGGLVLYYKRLEKGRFKRPKVLEGDDTIELDALELSLLLEGIKIQQVKRPKLWEPKGIDIGS